MFSFVADIITFVGFIIGLFQINWNNLSWENDGIFFIVAIVCLLLTIIFTFICIKKHAKINRCTNELLEFRQKISEMETELEGKNFDSCHEKLGLICNHVADTLTDMKGNRISVCVKILNGLNTSSRVECLVRDYKSLAKRRYSLSEDFLNENTDFHSIVKRYKNKGEHQKWCDFYYFNNNLPHSYDYRNSHLDSEALSTGLMGILLRHKQWNLDYKSTMTVPISDIGKDVFYGFLCIDSAKTYQFNKKNDLVMIKNIARDLWKITDRTLVEYEKERNK